jgi:hypothetical protein
MATQQFTYLLYDLLTKTPLGEVAMYGASFGSVLNGAGTFSGTLKLSDPRTASTLLTRPANMLPSQTALYIDLAGTLVWGGIIWTTTYDSTTQELAVGGNELWSYFAQRVISFANQADGSTLLFAGVDQLAVAQYLVSTAQSLPDGNIGVIVNDSVTSGVDVASISWSTTQQTTIAQAVTTLATQAGTTGEGEDEQGFDVAVDVAYASGTPASYLTLSYPRRGRISQGVSGSNIVFDTGSKYAAGYSWPVDGTKQANTVYGVGAGTGTASSGSGPLRSQQSLAGTGYPLLEASLSRTDITDQGILDATTLSYLAATAYPVALPVLTFDLGMTTPAFGSYLLGDDARVIVQPDEYYTTGYDGILRIVQWDVTVADNGLSTVALTFNAPPFLD